MYELLCGCDEKEVIISNIKGAIDYYEKDIEWLVVMLTQLYYRIATITYITQEEI